MSATRLGVHRSLLPDRAGCLIVCRGGDGCGRALVDGVGGGGGGGAVAARGARPGLRRAALRRAAAAVPRDGTAVQGGPAHGQPAGATGVRLHHRKTDIKIYEEQIKLLFGKRDNFPNFDIFKKVFRFFREFD